MTTIRKAFHSAIAISAVLLTTVSVRAEQADKYTKPHEPFTAPGMQVRMSLINPINRSQNDIRPTVFQEIAPCRLSSTLTADHYELPWGGTAYAANEARHYPSRGVLATQTFINPCSEAVPANAIGIVARFTVTPIEGDGEVHIDAFHPESATANTVLKFTKGQMMMFEAGIMLNPDGSFGVQTGNAGADVTIDLLGYLLPDPAAAGAKGDTGDTGATGAKGDKGDKGDTGATGAIGATGSKGDTGATGATGAKGDKGDTGAVGAKGDKGDTGAVGAKGDKGDTGAAGAKGDKGDKGDTGAIGATGAKGDKGDTGAVGAKGDKGDTGAAGAIGAKGDKGDTGAVGPQGAKGDKGDDGAVGPKGDTGAIGPKGDKGDDGAIGPKGDTGAAGPKGDQGERGFKGDKGDKGDNGTQGPMGPMGPMGPQGPRGPAGPVSMTAVKGGACYPPGNNANSQVTVNDSAVHANSIVILNYTDAGSNGNALALTSQSEGSFQTTGSPNQCFQYVVFNAAP